MALITHSDNPFVHPSHAARPFGRLPTYAELEAQVCELQTKLQLAEAEIARLKNGASVRKVATVDTFGRELVTQAEAARVLEVHQWQIHRWVAQKKLSAVDVPGRPAPMIVREGLSRPEAGRRKSRKAV